MERNVKQLEIEGVNNDKDGAECKVVELNKVYLSLIQSNEIDVANYEMDGVKQEIDGVNLETDVHKRCDPGGKVKTSGSN